MSRRIFITGANRGLGLELVRQLAERGDRIWAACRNPKQADALKDLQDRHAEQISIVALDVTDAASIRAAFDRVSGETSALDWLINNAGIGGFLDFASVTGQRMLEIFAVNSVAPLMIARTFQPLLKAGEQPVLANMSSRIGSHAFRKETYLPAYGYPESKAALNMTSTQLAIDLKDDGITVLPLSPGWVKTDMGGEEAPLEPAESIAGLVTVLDGVTLADTGRFLSEAGEEIPW
ncbi:MAG: SDR family oxidoreductase [Opitutales bacterium]